jgi:hypothetical protein
MPLLPGLLADWPSPGSPAIVQPVIKAAKATSINMHDIIFFKDIIF